MGLFEEIKSNWILDISNKLQEISSLKNSYPAWTIKTSEGYGVAVVYDGDDVREDFSNASMFCESVFLGEKRCKLLVLSSSGSLMGSAFTNLCFDFVNPGENGEFREALLAAPAKWWTAWKELLGNKAIDERVYDVIGELVVLKYYAQKGLDPKWNGPNQSSYDIETNDFFVEVKSSINRTKREVTISSIYQLSNLNKKLFLVFCTFEVADSTGISINSLVEDLKALGYNVAAINESLNKKGFEIGRSARNKRFLLHSMLRYEVDDSFPKITEQSFLNSTLPIGITDITYTVDLSVVAAINMVD